MSDALAISAVSFVLQYYLGGIYSAVTAEFGGPVRVSAVAPDIVQQEITSHPSPQNRVNLFLHQVTFNANWRNQALPSLAADGSTRLKNPPLALDLHYLLTAYGSHDWHAEGLLGYALLMMQQNPVIARSDIAAAFSALPGGTILPPYEPHNPISSFLAASGLADQLEMIKITPATLGREEMAWLWTALKADYRPTFPFQVSVVLISRPATTAFAFPVIKRHVQVRPISSAQLLQANPPGGKAAPSSGDTVMVTGVSVSGAKLVTLTNARLGIRQTAATSNVTDSSFEFVVPPDTAANPMPAGAYDLAALIEDSTGTPLQTTNTLPLAVAPVIVNATAASTATETTISVTCTPNILPVQKVSLVLAGPTPGQAVPAQPSTTTTDTPSFVFAPALPAGKTYVMQLQVDGIGSAVQWSPTPPPPSFTSPTVTI